MKKQSITRRQTRRICKCRSRHKRSRTGGAKTARTWRQFGETYALPAVAATTGIIGTGLIAKNYLNQQPTFIEPKVASSNNSGIYTKPEVADASMNTRLPVSLNIGIQTTPIMNFSAHNPTRKKKKQKRILPINVMFKKSTKNAPFTSTSIMPSLPQENLTVRFVKKHERLIPPAAFDSSIFTESDKSAPVISIIPPSKSGTRRAKHTGLFFKEPVLPTTPKLMKHTLLIPRDKNLMYEKEKLALDKMARKRSRDAVLDVLNRPESTRDVMFGNTELVKDNINHHYFDFPYGNAFAQYRHNAEKDYF